jgi:hypothetical protein
MQLNSLEKFKLRLQLSLFASGLLLSLGLAGIMVFSFFSERLSIEAAHSLNSLEAQAESIENEKQYLVGSVKKSDLNDDGRVDSLDLSRMLSSWKASGASPSADTDESGQVDIFDLSKLIHEWDE